MKNLFNNKNAYYEYEVLYSLESGIVFQGNHIRLIRENKFNMMDSYCYFKNNELFVKGVRVKEDELDIKLLLHKIELRKLFKDTQIKGNTIIPLQLYINNTGLIKLKIGLCKGKKIYDKRESIKEKDIKRDLERYGKY